jgi:hypothetical protein
MGHHPGGYVILMPAEQSSHLLSALKKVAAALRDAEIPFCLGGGLAAWARGGPATEHDVDLVIRESDADRALELMSSLGLRTERPPEGWLVKCWDGEVLIDLIFRPTGLCADDAFFACCEVLNVHAMRMPVMSTTDVVLTKLSALTEHNLDYGPVLEYARALREQLDWNDLETRTSWSPFAHGFFAIVRGLGLLPDAEEQRVRNRRPPLSPPTPPFVKAAVHG